MDKNKIILYGAAAAFVAITVCMFFPQKKEDKAQQQTQKPKNETPDIPQGEVQEVSDSKLDGYRRPNRNSAASEYWMNATVE